MATPTLYMFPSSYYSQKARLALAERCASYKEKVILISYGQQNDVSYLKMNPNGEVPMLKIGDTYVAESEKIIETVSQLPPGRGANVNLCPDVSTLEGKTVSEWRAKLDDFDVSNLTFGVVYNPELSIDGLKVPYMMKRSKEAFKAGSAGGIKKMEQLQEKHPELRQGLQRKINLMKQRLVTFLDKDLCASIMNSADKLMDDVENQMQNNKSGNSDNVFLCGPNFTAADITLCVLLGRLELIGIGSRYLDANKRPSLCAYWNMAKKRPTVKDIVLDNVCLSEYYMMLHKLKKVSKVAVCVGVACAGAFFVYKLLRD